MSDNLSSESSIVLASAKKLLSRGQKPYDDDIAVETGLDTDVVKVALEFLGTSHLNIKPAAGRVQVLSVDESLSD